VFDSVPGNGVLSPRCRVCGVAPFGAFVRASFLGAPRCSDSVPGTGCFTRCRACGRSARCVREGRASRSAWRFDSGPGTGALGVCGRSTAFVRAGFSERLAFDSGARNGGAFHSVPRIGVGAPLGEGTDNIRAEIHSKGSAQAPEWLPEPAAGRGRTVGGGKPARFCQEETGVLTEQFSSREHDAVHVPYM